MEYLAAMLASASVVHGLSCLLMPVLLGTLVPALASAGNTRLVPAPAAGNTSLFPAPPAGSTSQAAAADLPPIARREPTAFEGAAGWTARWAPAGAAAHAHVSALADSGGRLGLAVHARFLEAQFDLHLAGPDAAVGGGAGVGADGSERAVSVAGAASLRLLHGEDPVGALLAAGTPASEGLSGVGEPAVHAGRWQAIHIRADDQGLLITVDGVPVSRDAALGEPAPLVLQAAGAVHVANLRLRELDDLPGREVAMFPGDELQGWLPLGDAIWIRGEDEVLGEVGGGGQSFLVTQRTYGDFLFDVLLRNEDAGNSGIQVRSHLRENGRLFGYQIEIDPSPRAWSGGLYDEARRGWIDDLEGDDVARSAFRPGDWNHYRIECVGPTVKAWVNGLPTADVLDPLDVSGLLGLQVHSGDNTRIRFRRPRMRDLGTRVWTTLLDAQAFAAWNTERTAWRVEDDVLIGDGGALTAPDGVGDGALRIEYRGARALGLVLRLPAEAGPSAWERVVGAVESAGVDGPWLVPIDGGGLLAVAPPSEAWSSLAVCLAGDRVTLHRDGERLAELSGLPTSAGRLALVAPRGGVRVRRVEQLSEPVR